MKDPKDSTLRNVQAANKRIARLTERIKKLESEQKRQNKALKSLVKSFEEIIVT